MIDPSAAPKPTLAIFDFDGTITTRDSLLSFLFYTAGTWRTLGKLAKLVPAMAAFLLKRLSRQQAKEMILTRFFGGMSIAQLRELGETFATSRSMQHLVRPAANKRLAWHKRQQHQCVLISASVDAYLDAWAKMAGFDHVICSKLATTPTGNVTGRLSGLNCWGPEKVRRLEEAFGPLAKYNIYAYGDSRGDKELLAIADHSFFRHMPPPTPLT